MASPDTIDAIRASARDLKTLVEDYERKLILTALAEAGGHQRRAAASLGLLPTTLCEKIKRLGLRGRSDSGAAIS
jgi:DNA-binding NtrC family response regulator